jgi:hypothetical protein
MHMTVRQRADWIATFRHTSVFLMETLARWVPSTPEMEVKLLFGRHLWDFAQHADAFGKRATALRMALHSSRAPAAGFQRALTRFASAHSAAERMDALYGGLIPALTRIYREYIDETDHLMDDGSVRILERAIADFERMQRDREALATERPDIRSMETALVAEIRALAATTDVVDYRPNPQASETAP